jgi:hypothetical protein
MTHREFKLTVKKEIAEIITGLEAVIVRYRVGDVMMLDEETFLKLQGGAVVQRYTREGSIEFDKYAFENEVACTEVTVEYTVRKLGQRKNKVA